MDVTLNLHEDIARRLEEIPDKDSFVNRVLKQVFADKHHYTEEQLHTIRQSLAKAQQGVFASQEEVNETFDKYGSNDR